jgi:Rps23 Pro-64 3,4-dihydroxylase Tpa1-like proline 4-hydroxylase
LLEYARENRERFKDSQTGYGELGNVDSSQRISSILLDLGELKKVVKDRVKASLPEMFAKLGSSPFTPARIELELVAHGDGAFFSTHTDTFVRVEGAPSHRVISAVYYFHALPRAFSGGVLRLYALASGPEQERSRVEIEPENDTLAFFPSWYPHEVLPVKCPGGRFEDSRFAINCWVHRA